MSMEYRRRVCSRIIQHSSREKTDGLDPPGTELAAHKVGKAINKIQLQISWILWSIYLRRRRHLPRREIVLEEGCRGGYDVGDIHGKGKSAELPGKTNEPKHG